MAKVFFAIGLLCALGCAGVKELAPKTPAEAAILAVDAYDKADKAAMLACLAYKQGVLTGAIKASAKADAKCDSLVEDSDVEDETPIFYILPPEGDIIPVPSPTEHFPGPGTVPA